MKKTLMATSGLVAAVTAIAMVASGPAVGADSIKIGVSGSSQQWFGWVDEKNDGANGITSIQNLDLQGDNEIHFKGSTKLDNGLSVSFAYEMDSDGASNSGDEISVTVSGEFGSLNLGENDGAADRGSYAGGTYGIGLGDGNNWVRVPTGHANSILDSTSLDLDFGDANNVTYITPSMNGLQLGASYFPNAGTANTVTNETAGLHNGLALSITYNGVMGKNAVRFGANYMVAEGLDDDSLAPDDPHGFHVGGDIAVGGIIVGAAYLEENNVGSTTVATETTERTWQFNVRYAEGANSYSVGYMAGTSAVTGAEDKFDVLQVSYNRDLSGGVTWASTLGRNEHDGNGTGGAEDNSGVYVITGLTLGF